MKSSLIEAVHIYGGKEEALRIGPGALAEAYRMHMGQDTNHSIRQGANTASPTDSEHAARVDSNATSPLNALATAAISAAGDKRGFPKAGSHNQPQGSQVRTPCMSQLGCSPAADAVETCDERGTIEQIHVSPLHEAVPAPMASYQPTLQSQWRRTAEKSYPQQVAVGQSLLSGVPIISESRVDHSNMAAGDQSLLARWWPAAEIHGQQGAVAPNPFYSDPEQTDQVAVANEDRTTQEWDEAMQNALAQFGDGTTDDWNEATQEVLLQFGNIY